MTSWHRQRRSTVRDVGCNVANSAALVTLTRTKTGAGTATGASQPPSPRALARAHTRGYYRGAGCSLCPASAGKGARRGLSPSKSRWVARRRASSARVPPRRRPAGLPPSCQPAPCPSPMSDRESRRQLEGRDVPPCSQSLARASGTGNPRPRANFTAKSSNCRRTELVPR
jgi:hypothetical protein